MKLEQQVLSASFLPLFEVRIPTPDLAPWMPGNIGLPGFTSLQSSEPGPHVALLALTHGNEIAGATVIAQMLQDGVRPLRGTLTLGFANLAAFGRFDPEQPTASRFVDEDLNRVWDIDVLEGRRESSELQRARQMRPLIDRVDILLDLHSMLWRSEPLILCGVTEKGRRLAQRLGTPEVVVADAGHAGGRRLMDYDSFNDPQRPQAANLIEAGQHWRPETIARMQHANFALLSDLGMIARQPAPVPPLAPQRVAEVTHVITAATSSFGFVRAFDGGEIIERRNTLIAMDGNTEIRTPYDHCLLVMPSLRPSRGHTAIRLARFVS